MSKNFQFSIFNFQKGYTVLEILIGIAILGIAVTIITLSFSKLNTSVALDKSVDGVVSILNEARSLTLSAKGDSQYGVNLESSQVTLFKGASYLPSDPNNAVTPLNSLVGIRNIALAGGGTNVVFNRLTGATSNNGSFEIYLIDATTTYRTITISATGVAEEI